MTRSSERSATAVSCPTAKLIFTRDMISRAVKLAWKKANVKKFVFHNYRNTALTAWARRGIGVDVAMRASGHTSIQMHKRYVDLQAEDIAAAFGLKMVPTDGTQNPAEDDQLSANS